jgi:hypothetical protein
VRAPVSQLQRQRRSCLDGPKNPAEVFFPVGSHDALKPAYWPPRGILYRLKARWFRRAAWPSVPQSFLRARDGTPPEDRVAARFFLTTDHVPSRSWWITCRVDMHRTSLSPSDDASHRMGQPVDNNLCRIVTG